MNISINCPSYKRPKVETLDYLPFCKVWVDPKEFEDYITANPRFEKNMIKCEPGIQGNLCRVRNYILDQEFDNGADVVLIIDDDMFRCGYFVPNGRFGYQKKEIGPDEFIEFIEKYSLVCKEFGFYFWGLNCSDDYLAYRHYTPFSTVSYIGGPFQCFLKGNECRYDERLPLKEDYDMTLQNCDRYRGCLRLNGFFYNVRQAEQKGGCAAYRNYGREQEQLDLFVKKWGKSIVKMDNSNKGKSQKSRNKFDFNPIIKIPIKGV